MSRFTESYIAKTSPEFDHSIPVGTEWQPWIADELVKGSKQDHVLAMIPSERILFHDVWSVNNWLERRFDKHDPLIVWAGSAAMGLAGIAWVEDVTANRVRANFGIRVYEEFEHQGIARELSDRVHTKLDQLKVKKCAGFGMQRNNNNAFSIGARHGYLLEQRKGESMQYYQRPKFTHVKDKTGK